MRRYLVEAAPAGIALHVHHGQTVTGVLADALESGEQTFFDVAFYLLGLAAQPLFLLLRFGHDFIQFAFLLLQIQFTFGQARGGFCFFRRLAFLGNLGFANALLAQFDFQFLVFYLLGQVVVFAIVTHVFLLFFVFGYLGLGFLYFVLLVRDGCVDVLYFGIDDFQPGVQPHDFVFQVLHFERKLAAQRLDFIYLRNHFLEFIKRFELFFHRSFFFYFRLCSH